MKRLLALAGLLCLLALTLGVTGCAAVEKAPADASSLADTSWHLVSYGRDFWSWPLIPFTKITLDFDTRQNIVRGNAGCNQYGANFTVSDGNMTISNPVQTVSTRLLPPGVMQQEDFYLNTLAKVERLTASNRNLTIYCSNNIQLHFRPD